MSYYQGDFYRGDFYRGDPGFFSFLGKIGKSLLGIGGGPSASQVASKVVQQLGAGGTLAARGGAMMKAGGTLMRAGKGIVVKHPVLTGAAAAGTIGAMGVGAGRAMRGTGMRRHRRMRVTNPKALRRAIRRAEGFSRLAVRVLRFTHPHKVKGRPFFKIKRRARKV